MPNSDGLNAAEGTSMQVIRPVDSEANIYYLVSIGTDGMLYYHTINMDLNNGRGDVTAKNQLLDMAHTDYKDLMLAVEDPEAGLNHLYAARGTADLNGAAAGELEVLRYTFKGEIDGPMSYRSLFGYTHSFGLSDMQLSPGRKHLLVYNLTGLPEGFTGARTAEVYIYRLDDACEPVDETPQHIDLPEGTIPNSSAVFLEDNQTVVISTRSVSGDRLLGHNLAENTTTIAVEGTAGTLTTGRDGRLYVSPAGTTTTLAYESDMSPATGWTYDHILTGIRSFTAYKALDKGAAGSVLASRRVGFKTYELKDHLGNVRVLVSDPMKAVSDGNGGTFTDARVQAFNNYYPFGMLQTQRSQSATEYRFGFNGKEKDDEWTGNTGSHLDFGARIYDSRVGRWLSADPIQSAYPGISPFVFALNSPLIMFDPDGEKVKPSSKEALQIIKYSVTPDESKYIELNAEGYINYNRLVEGITNIENVSMNYTDLMEVVKDERIVEVHLKNNLTVMDGYGNIKQNDEISLPFAEPTNILDDWTLFGGKSDKSGTIQMMGKELSFYEFKNEINDGDDWMANGTLGVSLTPFGTPPNTEFDKMRLEKLPLGSRKYSTNSNYQVVLNKRVYGKGNSLLKKLVEAYSHETYGHILFGLRGLSMFHGPKRTSGSANEYNKELEERIKKVSNEAGKNFEKNIK